MNRIVKFLIIIGIILFFLFIQTSVINKQRSEILDTQNILDLKYQEYVYYNNIDINSEAMNLQEQDWAKMEDITKSDFTSLVENLQRSFQKNGWMILGFQRLEEDITKEPNADEIIEQDSNNLIKIKSISYEIQFMIENENIILPEELLSEITKNSHIDSIKLIIKDEDTLGVLNITYHQHEINVDLIPGI